VQYEAAGYVLVCFELDVDGYHWNAVYVKAEMLEKNYRGGVPDRLSVSAFISRGAKAMSLFTHDKNNILQEPSAR
jgi:hypothetical protein